MDLRSHLLELVTIMNDFNLLLPQCQSDIDMAAFSITMRCAHLTTGQQDAGYCQLFAESLSVLGY